MKRYDVVILGGGMAGLSLARQLRIKDDGLRILILEKSPKVTEWKVGEATVEIASSYFLKELNLTNYLFKKHLHKNGLRYFFDDEEKTLPIENMSEIGNSSYPQHPSFLIDRKVFEQDLIEMNRMDHIEVLESANFLDVEIKDDEPHVVHYEYGKNIESIEAGWVIDATGRKQTLLKKLNIPIKKDERLKTNAVWGRFDTVKDIDLSDNKMWRARVGYNTRMVATMHFMYKGYWFWFIPLSDGVYSIGVVFDREVLEEKITPKNFKDFLLKHKAIADLIEGSKMLDCHSVGNIAYYADQHFSEKRWAVTGESGSFADPFYSPGSDFIAISNDIIVDMVLNYKNIKPERFVKKVKYFNDFFRDRYERVMLLYIRNYKFFGSFKILSKKYYLDLVNYYNLFYWPYKAEKHTNSRWLNQIVKRQDMALALGNFQIKLLDDYYEYLETNNLYHTNNEKEWWSVNENVSLIFEFIKRPYNASESVGILEQTFAKIWLLMLEEIYDLKELSTRKLILDQVKMTHLLSTEKPLDSGHAYMFIEKGLKELKDLLNKQFFQNQVEDITPVDENRPLGEVSVSLVKGSVANLDLVNKLANGVWQEEFKIDKMVENDQMIGGIDFSKLSTLISEAQSLNS